MSNARELAELAAGYAGGGGLSFRNLIINGAMQVAQRTMGPTAVTFYTYNTADRMRFSNSGGTNGSWTQEVVTNQDVGDFVGNALKTTCTSAGGSGNVAGLNIRLELQDLKRFVGKKMTLSFYAKSDAPVTMTPGVFGDVSVNMDTFTFTTTYTRYVTTFTVPSLSTVTFFDLAMRVDGTVATSHYITGVQLELGSVATPFEHRQYATELALCQRYYCHSFKLGQAVAHGASDPQVRNLLAYSSNLSYSDSVDFPVPMRAAPSMVVYSPDASPTAGQWAYYDGTWKAASATNFYRITERGFNPEVNGAGFTAWQGRLCMGHWVASAEL